ncbi:MAG: ferredoxin [Candidatus Dependentiae bacterium]|nr:ferredoxin [Candidatus Dependentiae bacterium]
MKKVWIAPGCITCGRCEFIAPEVFEVLDVAYVKQDADVSKNEELIKEAVKTCPVNVINYDSDAKKVSNEN